MWSFVDFDAQGYRKFLHGFSNIPCLNSVGRSGKPSTNKEAPRVGAARHAFSSPRGPQPRTQGSPTQDPGIPTLTADRPCLGALHGGLGPFRLSLGDGGSSWRAPWDPKSHFSRFRRDFWCWGFERAGC